MPWRGHAHAASEFRRHFAIAGENVKRARPRAIGRVERTLRRFHSYARRMIASFTISRARHAFIARPPNFSTRSRRHAAALLCRARRAHRLQGAKLRPTSLSRRRSRALAAEASGFRQVARFRQCFRRLLGPRLFGRRFAAQSTSPSRRRP